MVAALRLFAVTVLRVDVEAEREFQRQRKISVEHIADGDIHQLRSPSEGGGTRNTIAQGIGFSHNFAAVGDAGKALVIFCFDVRRADLGKLQVHGAQKNQRCETECVGQPAALFVEEERGGA